MKKKKEVIPKQFELWQSYENVAMHFNDLILKLRVQALAVLVTFSSVLVILRETDTITPSTIILILFLILCGWTSIWILDMRYYNRLLEGSVGALLNVEKVEFKDFQKEYKKIQLSTSIEIAFKHKLEHEKTSRFLDPRNLFYFIFFMAILIVIIIIGFPLFKKITILSYF